MAIRSTSEGPSATRRGSIAVSLIWLSGLWLVVALIATGILLTSLYSRALDTSLTETLEFHAESLAGALLATGDPLSERIRLRIRASTDRGLAGTGQSATRTATCII